VLVDKALPSQTAPIGEPIVSDRTEDNPVEELLGKDRLEDEAQVANKPSSAPPPERPLKRKSRTRRQRSNLGEELKRVLRNGQGTDSAIRAIRRLQGPHPQNPYLFYLLGNLYFTKGYISDGLGAYSLAIKREKRYRRMAKINQNAIVALSHPKAYRKAMNLIVQVIGPSSLPYLRRTARHHPREQVRKRAVYLIRLLGK
jgi:hypothetical protein